MRSDIQVVLEATRSILLSSYLRHIDNGFRPFLSLGLSILCTAGTGPQVLESRSGREVDLVGMEH